MIEQDVNQIKVRFSDVEKNYILDKKYYARPRFEDDEQIVAAFTAYGRLQEQLKQLRQKLEDLQA